MNPFLETQLELFRTRLGARAESDGVVRLDFGLGWGVYGAKVVSACDERVIEVDRAGMGSVSC
jgi:hypothetical protein